MEPPFYDNLNDYSDRARLACAMLNILITPHFSYLLGLPMCS